MRISSLRINFKKILRNKIFSRNYSKLDKALKPIRLIPNNFMFQKMQEKVNFTHLHKRKFNSLTENPVLQLETIILKNDIKLNNIKDKFENLKNSNDMFSKHYKLLVKSTSENEMIKDSVQKEIEKKEEKMFKTNPLLIKNPKYLYFYYLGKSKKHKIEESNEKSINYIKKVLNIMHPFQLKKKETRNLNMHIKSNSNEIKNEITNEELIKYINTTNKSIETLNENNESSYEDNNDKKNSKMNITSSTRYFSPNTTLNSNLFSIKKKRHKYSEDFSVKTNNDIINIRQQFRTKSLFNFPKKNISSLNTSLKEEKYNFITSLYPKNQIQYYYEKIRRKPKLEKDELDTIENFFYQTCKTTNNIKRKFSSSQIYNSIKDIQIKLQNFNIKDSLKNIYFHKIPYETNNKIIELEKLDNKLKSFEGKIYKSIIENEE